MARIKTGFSILSDADLLIEVSGIIASMTGNVYFPHPVAPLSEVKDAYEVFSAIMSVVSNGNRDAVKAKNKTRALLERLLGELALYVQLRSKGDRIILLSSGFRLADKSVPAATAVNPAKIYRSEISSYIW